MTPMPIPGRRRVARAPSGSPVSSLDQRRIESALANRSRYKYVEPHVEREGLGWKVVSPNCSRNIDEQGGEIDIAWLVPHNEGGWLLFSRDHALDCWQLRHREPVLEAALQHLCLDPDRVFWP